MKKDFVMVAGLRTHYWHAGNGPTLLMLHGQLPGSCVAVEWGGNVQRFADAGYSVYAPDLSCIGNWRDCAIRRCFYGVPTSPCLSALLLQRAIPGAELQVLQGCGHWPQADRPERTFDIVNAFLREELGSTP